ncbi:metal ABC transporter solute-binding protein, Zn/Mn family [Helicobacter winghamensis]|uniref:ABC transporter n=1 Tax=Helicobacter winghamensis TaxID=157268 RepID=A0A2N3PIU0_9HELI|nr:zinc ABC transporter substrate-binding protein [Helicobacter winghamensis]EEO25261.1 ABC transporter, substrate-binding protein [Helicobacter winghamensis ATCC BAA-430]PKT76304.1 ABC transporter [Helicobacter winghamensis]PKT76435.1 ABC transporter [Helicobacter winghamensis]PKT76566.1 ABC transporter [Helicobacter winghamensis]PKT80815.1 ABC transporter [Helicobacter winghamensis]
MQKILMFVCLLLNFALAREVIAVSIPMQKEFVEKIAGDFYDVVSLVTPGVNPHDFEPKISEIRKVNEAVAYFAIGIEFEESWLPRFKGQNQTIQVFNTGANISRINFSDKHYHNNHHHNGDTHIWLSPNNAKIIATNIYESLKKLESKKDFSQNYNALMLEIDALDRELKVVLKDLPKHQKFVVFHPMLGYFARDYHLDEISIEVEGKSPKMQEMIVVIETIKRENLKTIFAQPEFSTKAAEFIAKESGAKLGYFSPLQTPWKENLLNFAKTLVEFEK